MVQATQIYLRSVNNSGTQILRDLGFRGDKRKLPPYAQRRLKELESDSMLKSKYIPSFKPRLDKKQRSTKKESLGSKVLASAILYCLVVLFVIMIVGFITVFSWIF